MKTFKQLLEATSNGWLGFSSPKAMESNNYKNDLNTNKFHKDGLKLHHVPDLKEHEKDSVKAYGGDIHIDLNQYHRDQDPEFYNNPRHKSYADSMKRHTEHLDSAMRKHTTEHPIHVWRGIKEDAVKQLGLADNINKVKYTRNGGAVIHGEDKIIHDKGYVSTSINPEVAHEFTGMAHNNEKYLMHIKVPKGSHAIHTASHDLHFKLSDQEEHEVLLPRNSKFKHTKTTIHPDGSTIFHLTHIPEKEKPHNEDL